MMVCVLPCDQNVAETINEYFLSLASNLANSAAQVAMVVYLTWTTCHLWNRQYNLNSQKFLIQLRLKKLKKSFTLLKLKIRVVMT
jgi:hypothetical protein